QARFPAVVITTKQRGAGPLPARRIPKSRSHRRRPSRIECTFPACAWNSPHRPPMDDDLAAFDVIHARPALDTANRIHVPVALGVEQARRLFPHLATKVVA